MLHGTSGGYAKSLFPATPQDQLADSTRKKSLKGLTDEQVSLMERESARLDREFKMVGQSYGTDHLDLVLAKGFFAKLLANARVIRYLSQHHQELLSEFHKVATLESSAAYATAIQAAQPASQRHDRCAYSKLQEGEKA